MTCKILERGTSSINYWLQISFVVKALSICYIFMFLFDVNFPFFERNTFACFCSLSNTFCHSRIDMDSNINSTFLKIGRGEIKEVYPREFAEYLINTICIFHAANSLNLSYFPQNVLLEI